MPNSLLKISAAVALAASTAQAQDVLTYLVEGTVEDAAFLLESAIVGEGLVIDFTSHVGEMLDRTGADMGADGSPVGAAQSFVFCSAAVSREVMEADPLNVAYCPYSVFAAEVNGRTVVGHRVYPGDSMAPVNELLARIVAAATE